VRFASLITCVVLVSFTSARADNEADRLFEEGRTLAAAGKYAEACDRFEKSLAKERSIGTELNLADCHEKLGQYREAWELFITAANESEAAGKPNAVKKARDSAARLEPQMTTMVVKVAQPELAGLVITINGRATQPAAEIHEHADPGQIDVIATAPNVPVFKKSEAGKPGETVTVEIPVLDTNAKVPDHHPPPPPPETIIHGAGERDRGRVHIAYVLGAGGTLAAGAAIALTIVAKNHYNLVANDTAHCQHVVGGIMCDTDGTNRIHDAQHIADYGTVCAIGSALLFGGAAVVYFTAPRADVKVTPTATAQSVGVSVSGAF
jgi:hypothetical protein